MGPGRGIDIDFTSLEKVAVLTCHNTKSDETTFVCEVDIYLAYKWTGEPEDTDEMYCPQWYFFAAIPLNKLMLADREWLPLVLRGKKLKVEAHYGPYQQTLLKPVVIEEVKDFE